MLIKIGARVVRHARAITFHMAEVAVTGPMVRAISPPSAAFARRRHVLDLDFARNRANAARQVCPTV